MAIVTRYKFPNELDKAIDKVYMDIMTSKAQSDYTKIAKVSAAPAGDSYVESAISGLGALDQIGEGQGVSYQIPVEGNKKSRTYSKFGLGFVVTEEAIQDSVHRNALKAAETLADSAIQKINTEFFDLFNSGFDTHTGWDGEYIFTADHPLLNSTTELDNEPGTPVDLDETALQAGFEYFWNLKNQSGFPAPGEPAILLVANAERWNAEKLYSGDRVLGSANNDYLTTNPKYGIVPSWRVISSPYLTDDDAWFLLGKDHDFRLLWKMKPTMNKFDDPETGNRKYTVKERFSVFCNNPLHAYGSPGS